jgi:hypothetical protein
VFRDLDAGHNEYLGQGTGWVFIPDSDPVGSRAMPPYAGPGNGGWTTDGGPIMTLKGQDIHVFIVPTGVRPGTVLEVGDVVAFGGHIMPTLPSRVAATVTSPVGAQHEITGQANPVGYFFSEDTLVVDEPGVWTVDVSVWHDGTCSGGPTVPPYPSGDVLGSDGGRFEFYVPTLDVSPLEVTSPDPGHLIFGEQVNPVKIGGLVPTGVHQPVVHYTMSMPGVLLEQGEVRPAGERFEIVFDAETLHASFPNLELTGRHVLREGLSDTVSISMLLEGTVSGEPVYHAASVTLQGDQVSVGSRLPPLPQPPRRPSRRVP